MNAPITLPSSAAETAVPAEASDALRGRLPRPEQLRELEYQDLVQLGQTLSDNETALRLTRAAIAAEVVSRAGQVVADRRRALEAYCAAIRFPVKKLQTDLRIARYISADEVETTYPDLTPGHLWVAVHMTARNGEAPDAPERLERVREALDLAQSQNLKTTELKKRLLANQQPQAAAKRRAQEARQEHVARLLEGLETRLRLERPSTDRARVALLERHLLERFEEMA